MGTEERDRVARIEAAQRRAREDRAGIPREPRSLRERTLPVAIGDPQTSFRKVLEVLDHHLLLGEDGCLRDEVLLVSIGDHFDFGPFPERFRAAEDSLEMLHWLAAHPEDQVVLLAGNHDLGRVGELAGFDDASFREASEQAARAYRQGDPDPELEAALLRDFPALPSAEVGARDLSCFLVEQRELVASLIASGRLRVAEPWGPACLLTHAGIPLDTLVFLGLDAARSRDSEEVARVLNQALLDAYQDWRPGTPLDIPGLHRAGSAAAGEGGGVFFHRPGLPDPSWSDPPPLERAPGEPPPLRRVFDPRRLPLGLTQVVGHVRDHRCRKLLGAWARPEPDRDGVLRHLESDGEDVVYGHGIPEGRDPGRAHMIFLDVGWNLCQPEEIEILDLDQMRPLEPRRE